MTFITFPVVNVQIRCATEFRFLCNLYHYMPQIPFPLTKLKLFNHCPPLPSSSLTWARTIRISTSVSLTPHSRPILQGKSCNIYLLWLIYLFSIMPSRLMLEHMSAFASFLRLFNIHSCPSLYHILFCFSIRMLMLIPVLQHLPIANNDLMHMGV